MSSLPKLKEQIDEMECNFDILKNNSYKTDLSLLFNTIRKRFQKNIQEIIMDKFGFMKQVNSIMSSYVFSLAYHNVLFVGSYTPIN